MAGVRSSKTVNGTEYKFTTLSGLVTRQEWNGSSIDFIYDESGQPLAMKYNGTLYYYILNAQGDVVRIVDGSRSTVASYTYDPWGNITSSSGALADVNPLRYRGYYYDSETGFYYLQSRYYDPELGRFINADSYASTDATGLLSANMFAYCENDPVNRSDINGKATISIFADLNATLLLGVDIGIGLSFDDSGNIAIQWFYSQPFDDETTSVGLADIGASLQLQFTECATVNELNGVSSSSGLSAGGVKYFGIDYVSNKRTTETIRNPKDAKGGVKLYCGIGVGIDIHEQQTKTQTIKITSLKQLWEKVKLFFCAR